MLNCVYHPTLEMRVVTDEERIGLLKTGTWFDTPKESNQMRKDYERRIQQGEKPRKRTRKLKAENDGIGTQLEQCIREEPRSDGSIDGRQSS